MSNHNGHTINATFIDDTIDVRHLIERFESLDSLRDNAGGTFNAEFTEENANEWQELRALLNALKGLGGDEQWRGDWYPLTLIEDAYFPEYAKQLLEDCGTIPRDFPAWIAIDWERTAEALQGDYTPVEINGLTYWTR